MVRFQTVPALRRCRITVLAVLAGLTGWLYIDKAGLLLLSDSRMADSVLLHGSAGLASLLLALFWLGMEIRNRPLLLAGCQRGEAGFLRICGPLLLSGLLLLLLASGLATGMVAPVASGLFRLEFLIGASPDMDVFHIFKDMHNIACNGLTLLVILHLALDIRYYARKGLWPKPDAEKRFRRPESRAERGERRGEWISVTSHGGAGEQA